ncbi:SHOCT domain-containing protein [[Clostridium] innocuum]|uniref:SHOCT domain-containing protein n=1 Tax=Clostridium innocuum TaxID=1522 RepID=UPI003A4E5315
MGLFRAKGICSICGNEKAKEIKDGFVCSSCVKQAGRFLSATKLTPKEQTLDLINYCINKTKIYTQNQEERKNIFNQTKKISSLLLDEKNRLFRIKDRLSPDIYSYFQIIDYEILEDGESIAKGGLGRAIAGGILLGGVGAVVGGVTGGKKTKGICKSLQIRIGLKEAVDENIYIKLITSETKTKSFLYKGNISIANDIINILSKIADDNELLQNSKTSSSIQTDLDPYEELKKAKELLDLGIITQEEFEIKKNKLLSL